MSYDKCERAYGIWATQLPSTLAAFLRVPCICSSIPLHYGWYGLEDVGQVIGDRYIEINYGPWIALIVPILKPDRKICVCVN